MKPFTDCRFYLRSAAPGGYTYTSLGDGLDAGRLPVPQPPATGDLVGLGGGVYRVVGRCWNYPSRGSADWPPGRGIERVSVTVLVEQADGLFTDEVPLPSQP